jgi:hypothetical protein
MAAALGLAVALAGGVTLAGCGDSAPDDPLLGYLGTWQYTKASGSASCPGGAPIDETPTGNKIFARGISTALVDLTALTLDRTVFCDFGFDVMGPEAKATVGQGCALRGGDLFTVKNWTFSLTSETTAEEVASADLTVSVLNQPQPIICTYSMMATLTRISKD